MKSSLVIPTIIILATTTLALNSYATWEYPNYAPSYDNQVAPPVNTSPTPQTKHSNLTLQGGSMIIDSNLSGSNALWTTLSTNTAGVDSDGPLSIHGALSTTDISAMGYLSGSLISTVSTTPAERPLCVRKSDGRIMPCTPDTTTPPTKSLPQ